MKVQVSHESDGVVSGFCAFTSLFVFCSFCRYCICIFPVNTIIICPSRKQKSIT